MHRSRLPVKKRKAADEQEVPDPLMLSLESDLKKKLELESDWVDASEVSVI